MRAQIQQYQEKDLKNLINSLKSIAPTLPAQDEQKADAFRTEISKEEHKILRDLLLKEKALAIENEELKIYSKKLFAALEEIGTAIHPFGEEKSPDTADDEDSDTEATHTSAIGTLEGDTPKLKFANVGEFEKFATEVFNTKTTDADSKPAEVKVKSISNGFEATQGNKEIRYTQDGDKPTLTATGEDPIKTLAKAIEAYVTRPEYAESHLHWILSDGISVAEVRKHLSEKAKQRTSFNQEKSASATHTDTRKDTTAEEKTKSMLADKKQFYEEIGAAKTGLFASSNVEHFVSQHGDSLAQEFATNGVRDYVKPYLTEIFTEALKQEKDALAVAIAEKADNTLLNIFLTKATQEKRLDVVTEIVKKQDNLTLKSDTIEALLTFTKYTKQIKVDEISAYTAAQLLQHACETADTFKRLPIPALLNKIIQHDINLSTKDNLFIRQALATAIKFLASNVITSIDNITYEIEPGNTGTISAEMLIALNIKAAKHLNLLEDKNSEALKSAIQHLIFQPQNRIEIITETFAKLTDESVTDLSYKTMENAKAFSVLLTLKNEDKAGSSVLKDKVKLDLAKQAIEEKTPPAATDILMFQADNGVLAYLVEGEVDETITAILHYITDKLTQGIINKDDIIVGGIKVENANVLALTNKIIESKSLPIDDKISLVSKIIKLPANKDNQAKVLELMQEKQKQVREFTAKGGSKPEENIQEMLKSIDGAAVLGIWYASIIATDPTKSDQMPFVINAAQKLIGFQHYIKKLESRSRLNRTDNSRVPLTRDVFDKTITVFTHPTKTNNDALNTEVDKVDQGKLHDQLIMPHDITSFKP